jgi:hypothetical protein
MVGESVWLHGSIASVERSTAAGRAAGAAEPATTTVTAASKAAASGKSSATKAAAAKASASAKAAAAVATSAHARTSETILTDLKQPAVPLIAVVLLDGVPSIVGRLEHHNARALGSSVGAQMDVGANNAA